MPDINAWFTNLLVIIIIMVFFIIEPRLRVGKEALELKSALADKFSTYIIAFA